MPRLLNGWRAATGVLPLLAAGFFAMTVAGPAVAAPAAIPGNSFAYDNGGNPSNCLDASVSNIFSNGDPVTLEPCTGGANQEWYRPLSGDRQELVNAMSGLCLDANNNNIHSNGDNVQEWSCWSGANQHWSIGGAVGELVNGASGLCLEADNNHILTNGDVVDIWSCWDGPNQQWYVH
jgi:hypothetical protein